MGSGKKKPLIVSWAESSLRKGVIYGQGPKQKQIGECKYFRLDLAPSTAGKEEGKKAKDFNLGKPEKCLVLDWRAESPYLTLAEVTVLFLSCQQGRPPGSLGPCLPLTKR